MSDNNTDQTNNRNSSRHYVFSFVRILFEIILLSAIFFSYFMTDRIFSIYAGVAVTILFILMRLIGFINKFKLEKNTFNVSKNAFLLFFYILIISIVPFSVANLILYFGMGG